MSKKVKFSFCHLAETYNDVFGVLDSSDDSGGDHEFFPGLADVDDVNSFPVAFEDVGFHKVCAVLRSDVCL